MDDVEDLLEEEAEAYEEHLKKECKRLKCKRNKVEELLEEER